MINYTMATITSPYALIFGVLLLLAIIVWLLYVVNSIDEKRQKVILSRDDYARLHRVAEKYHRFMVVIKARKHRKVFVEGWLVPSNYADRRTLESDYAVIGEILHRQVKLVDIEGIYYLVYTTD